MAAPIQTLLGCSTTSLVEALLLFFKPFLEWVRLAHVSKQWILPERKLDVLIQAGEMWQALTQAEPDAYMQDLRYETTGVWGLEGEHLFR